MKITLANGTIVEGTLEQIQRVAVALGERVPFTDDGIHYNSTSRGVVRITDMDTQHLRNALLKRYATFVANLKTYDNARVSVEIANPSDKTLVGLMAELTRRRVRGQL